MQLYEGLPGAFQRVFGAPISPAAATPLVLPANASFKLASEVALMIIFLLQSYPKRLNQYAPTLLPVMAEASFDAGVRGPAVGEA